MGTNFEFLATEWPETYADCARAEEYGRSDPRSCVFYARRAVERVVVTIYDLAGLAVPYRSDLSARIGDPAFVRLVGPDVAAKATLVRRVGNIAVHEARPINEQTALNVLRELHHLTVWAAFRYLRTPDAVPTARGYDPSLIPAPSGGEPPLSREELNQLLTSFEEKERALADEKAASAALQAEIAELRAQVAAAQAAKTQVDAQDLDEATTRDLFIDVLLNEAGWPLDQERDRELEVSGMPNERGVGYVDYVLWGADDRPLAVVEAKRTRRDPQDGERQAELYADCLEQQYGRRPVIYYTNGYTHWLWDDAGGYPPRQVQGFHTRDELELMVQRRTTRQPLAEAPIDPAIVERHYQHRAIRSVGAAFEQKQRRTLLVMATGSGKTRTVIALVDQLMKAGWVKRVLFLADRVALVNQAVAAFREHLPSATTVNLVKERDAEGRVYVSTYPTMMGLVDASADGRFGPGYFDLVVVDEAHRSIYQKYGVLFDWFDSLLVGLTATPKDEVDRNTYTFFQLEDGVPTDAYDLEQAVAEKFLVPYVGVDVPLRFVREGIRYDERSEEEKDAWDLADWADDGEVPDEVSAAELNTFLFNADTVDKVIETLMNRGHRVAGGDRIAKTIVFAKNTAHADFIRQRFDEAYPEQAGDLARVIVHRDYTQSLIDDFSRPEKTPDVAISVDMLDTGIDVPDVANLVLFKTVRSKAKFWQMIGRGTRLRRDLFGPGEDKPNFYVFDFCQNLEFFSQDPPTAQGSLQQSLGERLFRARLGLVTALDESEEPGDEPDVDGTSSVAGLRWDTARVLHRVVAGMNTDSFVVRRERAWVEKYADWSPWGRLEPVEAADVADHLAGLPSAVRDDDESAKRFDLLLLRLQLALLEGDALLAERVREQVRAIATSLLTQTMIPAVAQQQQLLDDLAGDAWWVDVTLPMLELARRRIRSLVQLIPLTKRRLVYTDFEDQLGPETEIVIGQGPAFVDPVRFREKLRAYLREHEDHVALQRLRRNKQLTAADLEALEQMLLDSGAGGPEDLARAQEEAQGLGLFVRSLVGLDRAAATEAFGRFLLDTVFTAQQIDFVNQIVEDLTTNGVMEAARLYESPYTDSAPHGPEGIFDEADVDGIVLVLDQVRKHALVAEVADSA